MLHWRFSRDDVGGCLEVVVRIVVPLITSTSVDRAWCEDKAGQEQVETRFLCLGERLLDDFHLALDLTHCSAGSEGKT